ncbi:UNVERIFIED_CONTAM: Retrovirus-related Pol polyprotein from transposon RE1 [Sesamum indicum]
MNNQYRIDYVVTTSVFLAVATGFHWPIHQCYINNAFLHGFFDEDIFMDPPAGYEVPLGKSLNDYCLFVKGSTDSLIIVLIYVDDLLITGPSEVLIAEVKNFLDATFSIKDLGYAKYFLGLEIARSTVGTSVTQHKYIHDLIIDTGLEHCKPVSTPLPLGLKLSSHSSPRLADSEPYCRLVDRLLYLGFIAPTSLMVPNS